MCLQGNYPIMFCFIVKVSFCNVPQQVRSVALMQPQARCQPPIKLDEEEAVEGEEEEEAQPLLFS